MGSLIDDERTVRDPEAAAAQSAEGAEETPPALDGQKPPRCIGRADGATLIGQAELFLRDGMVRHLVDAVPDLVLVLNQHRQILVANSFLLEALHLAGDEALLGLRPGEALGCAHSKEGADGCGTGAHCAVCGTARALGRLEDEGRGASEECLLTTVHEGKREAGEFLVHVSPIRFDHGSYTLFVAKDLSAQKRQRALERSFFHDVLNSAGGLISALEAIVDETDDLEFPQLALRAARTVVEEIESHRALQAAEAGELHETFVELDGGEILENMVELYRGHTVALDRTIRVEQAPSLKLRTDGTLLGRVLGNMIKNALEGSASGGRVEVGLEEAPDGRRRFWVRNSKVMSEEVRLQVFQRSFSTKGGHGRGVGTYSMKLFGEEYLKGEVGFRSTEGEGTVFYLLLPR